MEPGWNPRVNWRHQRGGHAVLTCAKQILSDRGGLEWWPRSELFNSASDR
jgi:hypothetical protein